MMTTPYKTTDIGTNNQAIIYLGYSLSDSEPPVIEFDNQRFITQDSANLETQNSCQAYDKHTPNV